MSLLADTSIVIAPPASDDDERPIAISVITLGEFHAGVELARDDSVRSARLAAITRPRDDQLATPPLFSAPGTPQLAVVAIGESWGHPTSDAATQSQTSTPAATVVAALAASRGALPVPRGCGRTPQIWLWGALLGDGETRTRTGDTTIFRQMLRTLEHARKRLQIAICLAPDWSA